MIVKTKMGYKNISMDPEITKLEEGRFKYKSNKPFYFENGKSIPNLELQYDTYGSLNQDKSNVILIHHSLSVGANVSKWWKGFIGDGLVLDTKKYFIICINNLGSCFGSSGPSLNTVNPKTKKPYLRDFPEFNFNDIAKSQLELLEYLKISKIHAVVGSSMGGMISLSMLSIKPNMVENMFLCATSYKSYPFNAANRMVQKEVIENSIEYKNGFYSKNPENAVKLARKIGLLFYRGIPELNQRFAFGKDSLEEIYSYYEYNADKFSKIFDANSYIYTLNCMDSYNLNLENILNNKNKKIFVIGIDSDILFPVYQQEELYLKLKKLFDNVNYIIHKTVHGHDSFFIEIEQFSNYLQDFLK